jgi:hypothetical protein
VEDLIAWLRTQLDEDERVAREAARDGGTWRGSDSGIYYDYDSGDGPFAVGSYEYLDDRYWQHITRWDPARVLAEVEAKRRILDWLIETGGILDAVEVWSADVGAPIRMLALPYAGRDGWREEWRA